MKREMTRGGFFGRRVLAVLMIVMLIVSIVAPNVVWAEETHTTTNGYYDESGEWHQGGDGVFEYLDGNLSLSKTARPIEGKDNIFEIILKVTTKQSASIFKPNALATVLIIDCSGSMKWCEDCGTDGVHTSSCSHYSEGRFLLTDQTRMYAAKQAAIQFLDAMRKDAEEGSGRYVTLVRFSNDATNTVETWQDVTTASGYNTVKDAINNLSANGGTNLDDSLGHALELIQDDKLSTMPKGGKNVVILTDGTPTYYVTPEGYRGGDSQNCTKVMIDDTIVAATALRGATNVFTVCYDAENTTTYSGGPTVGDFLEDSVASPATGDIKYAYNVKNADELIDSFMNIVDAELEAAQVTITDPIPENITIPEGGLPEGIKYENGVWSLHGIAPEEKIDGDIATYTYTITYKVEIDPYAAGMEEGKFYPANKKTYVIMSDGNTYEFPVPGIMPIPQKFDVIFNSGEHGVIDSEDENGNIVHEGIIKGKPTPDAPSVTPDDGWYFVGWTPEVSETVENTVTYVAVYSPKQAIVVTGNSDTKTYNAMEQSVEWFTVSGLPQGWTLSGITYSATGTNASETPYVGSFEGTPVIMDENGTIVSADQYVLILTVGELTITKRDLTITADSNSKPYDGTALTDNGWQDVAPNGLADGDTVVSVVVTGSQTEVGQSLNVASDAVVMNGNIDVTANYNVTYVNGTLTVTRNTNVITITANSDSKTYDGTALVNSGFTFTQGILADGDVLTAVVEGAQTNVGTSVNEVVSYKVMRGDNDVTANYTIVTVNGTLEVTKRDLIITADSATKIYDGTALTDNGWSDTNPTGLANGDTVASVTVVGSQTEVGQSLNIASGAKVMRGDTDVTENYNITYVDGTLAVSVVGTPITITANSNSKIYDGLALIDGGYTFTQGVLAQGDVLIVTVSGSQTNVGTSANEVASYRVMRGDKDVTSYYTFATPVDGTLTVTKIDTPIVILPNSFGKVYDGTALTASGAMYTFTTGILVNGDELIAEVYGSQLNVGSSANVVVSYKIVNGNDDVTANYTIQCADGILEVYKRDVTIYAASDSKYYDGTALTNNGFSADGLADGDEIAGVTVVGSQTDVGMSSNIASNAVIKNSSSEDVTANYNIRYENGKLVVMKNEEAITITANSDSKEYDGTPLTNDGYTFTGKLADGDELVIVVEGSQTFVGTSENKVVSYKVMRGDEDVTANYTFDIVDGVLEVTRRVNAVTITAASDSKEYDGTPLTNDGYTVSGELADGDELVAVVEGSRTFVGTSENEVVSYKVVRGDTDVTESYTIATVNGTLTVTKNTDTLTITAVSDSRTYDGAALVNGGYSFTQGILADGDVLVADVSGTQTFAGTSTNEVVSYKVMRGEVDVTENYTIVTVNGTLEVIKRDLIITADSATKIYDGTALTDNGWNDTKPTGLANGDTVVSVTVVGSQTNVGNSANVASNAKIMRDDKDVTGSYNVTYVDGTLAVTKDANAITITAASDSKIYDGTALINAEYSYTQGILADGDVLTAVVEGSITNAGVSTNKIVSYKVMRGDIDVTANYTIVTVDGTLEVTKRDITITAESDSKEYDGTPLTNSSVLAEGIIVGDTVASVTVVGSQTFVGQSLNVASDAVIMNGENDVTANYNITYVDGTLTVTKNTGTITVTANSDSKIYDGTPLTNDGYTFTGELAQGDEIVIVVEGSQTFAGSSANKVVSSKVVRDGVDVTDNYTIETVDGTLTVEKIGTAIVVVAGSDTKPYDGTPLTNDTYTFTQGVLLEGDRIVVVIEGSQTEVGQSANKVVSIKVMRGEIDVTDSYNIGTPVDGELVITEVVPNTGDNSNITLWNVMMFVSLLTLFVLALTSRKQRAR